MGQMNVCSVKFVNTYPQNVDKYLKSVENFKKGIDTIYKDITKNNYYIGGIVEKNNTLYYNDVSKKQLLKKLSTKSTELWIIYVDKLQDLLMK